MLCGILHRILGNFRNINARYRIKRISTKLCEFGLSRNSSIIR
uniref:Uncharacterized protein MANES_09G160200 n=1 Tax=Rhizophora mucronata TaxID=61149 RepID=A0A2P2K2P2_RHIMU